MCGPRAGGGPFPSWRTRKGRRHLPFASRRRAALSRGIARARHRLSGQGKNAPFLEKIQPIQKSAFCGKRFVCVWGGYIPRTFHRASTAARVRGGGVGRGDVGGYAGDGPCQGRAPLGDVRCQGARCRQMRALGYPGPWGTSYAAAPSPRQSLVSLSLSLSQSLSETLSLSFSLSL